MANFWESFLANDLKKPDDPGGPSMPYGPPLWSTPEQHFADMRDYEPPRHKPWFGQQQFEFDPQRTNQPAAIQRSSSPTQIDIGALANAQPEALTPTFAIISNPVVRSFDDLAQQVSDDQSPLKRLHPESTYQNDQTAKGALEYWRTQTTPQIIESLRPGTKESLQVRPDGTIGNGNTRIIILQERGFDVNSLPRDIWNPNLGGGRGGGGKGGGGRSGGWRFRKWRRRLAMAELDVKAIWQLPSTHCTAWRGLLNSVSTSVTNSARCSA